jgi:hypothetical protein
MSLSASHTDSALLPIRMLYFCVFYPFVLEVVQTPGPIAAQRISKMKKCNYFTVSVTANFRLAAQCLNFNESFFHIPSKLNSVTVGYGVMGKPSNGTLQKFCHLSKALVIQRTF